MVSGFVRSKLGVLTTFSIPEASGCCGAMYDFLNKSGDIAGYYNAGTSGAQRYAGFVRNWFGTLTTFQLDESGYLGGGTIVTAFNDNGTAVGSYPDTNNVIHGFMRDEFGNVTTFLPSGALSASVNAINDGGEMAGTYVDADKVSHGFVVRAERRHLDPCVANRVQLIETDPFSSGCW
jgi:uncharacterized membrane protein